MLKILSIIAIVLILSACESSVVKPEEHIAKHPEWDEQTVQNIRRGIVLPGMTKAQVRAAWGNPCETCPGSKKFEWGETWEYPTQVVFFNKEGQLTETRNK